MTVANGPYPQGWATITHTAGGDNDLQKEAGLYLLY
jgi:hypothetical protein